MPKQICLFLLFLILSATAYGQRPQRLDLDHADALQVLLGATQDTTVAVGSVHFRTESGAIACDSAVWIRGTKAILRGSVMIEDPFYRLLADSVDYDLVNNRAVARGPYVELWSRTDSLFATGTYAYYDRSKRYFRMENRPTVYLNYPDSAKMVRVDADLVECEADSAIAIAQGNSIITSKDIKAISGRAVMHQKAGLLELYDKPVLERGASKVKGRFIEVMSEENVLKRIEVTDSAHAEFKETVDTLPDNSVLIDQSILTGRKIFFDFLYGTLNKVTSIGQAYSWYYPAKRGGDESNENAVSGDTIQFTVANDQLQTVTVIGGAVGAYVSMKEKTVDSVVVTTRDTVDYSAAFIRYQMTDSVITLLGRSHIESGTVQLDAHQVLFDTQKRLIKAYSADIVNDSFPNDTTLTARFQPNPIPVVLKDKKEELYGDFLEYSIDTEKGKIVQSKSKYETGFYYGERVYRARENIFYVEDGRYTTCDADEPHFHFYSKHMKLIEDDKLIAQPVVFNIGRLPILALPYYVFPLKKGRHSGILPFKFGNLEQGERYIDNVGYYWAASDHYDLLGSMSFHEARSSLTLSGQFRYKNIYVFDGGVSGHYTKETDYDYNRRSESKSTRYDIRGSHSHEFSPDFKLNGSGQYVSDKSYYTDYSTDLSTRLENNIYGKVDLFKRFSKSVSLTGNLSHTDYLKAERRIDNASASVTLPLIRPFGSGKLDEDGQLKSRWFNYFIITPRNSFAYQADRRRVLDTLAFDTSYVVDSTTMDSTLKITADTASYESRKKYAQADFTLGTSMPLTMFSYIKINPSFSYRENWQYPFETDQTQQLGIKPDIYRTYSYSAGVSAGTEVYGTVYPNAFGLIGLRQQLSPTVTYSFEPKLDRNAKIRSYTGAGVGSSAKAQRLIFGLRQYYQAKVKQGDGERNLELVDINSSFSYDLERDSLQLSPLSTSFQSNLLPKIRLSGDMTHSFYRPGTSQTRFFSPYLENFSLSASLGFSGGKFLFDDDPDLTSQPTKDTTESVAVQSPLTPQPARSKGWQADFAYRYSESGRGNRFVKSSYLQFRLEFSLTPTTSVNYSQYYDIGRGVTVRNEVTFRKTLHCWTGEFRWVPIGSGRGYSFILYVTAIPAIKVDNSSTANAGSFLNR